MANIQVKVCGSAEAYHAKHEVVVKELHKAACDASKKHYHQHGAMTGGSIKNLAKGNCIKFVNKHDWSGSSRQPYPHSISKCHFGTFAHSSDCKSHNDEAAVIYSDECGTGFLLAWLVTDQTGGCENQNKVYVESGPIENYKCVKWSDIRVKLEDSSDTSYYVDPCTGNETFASVTRGNKATLAASFSNFSC